MVQVAEKGALSERVKREKEEFLSLIKTYFELGGN